MARIIKPTESSLMVDNSVEYFGFEITDVVKDVKIMGGFVGEANPRCALYMTFGQLRSLAAELNRLADRAEGGTG